MTKVVGLFNSVISYNLRRGALYNTIYLPRGLSRTTFKAISSIARYTATAHIQGVTESYIGSLTAQQPLWDSSRGRVQE